MSSHSSVRKWRRRKKKGKIKVNDDEEETVPKKHYALPKTFTPLHLIWFWLILIDKIHIAQFLVSTQLFQLSKTDPLMITNILKSHFILWWVSFLQEKTKDPQSIKTFYHWRLLHLLQIIKLERHLKNIFLLYMERWLVSLSHRPLLYWWVQSLMGAPHLWPCARIRLNK